ncbi:MAG: asparagine synthase (glutamine-hydrolyzing), partial [Betaproteobacteria bacterium]
IRSIRYRGPDDEGTWAEGPVGLAHARLSIIDLAGGHQPMSDEQGTLWITFNGEIFNYIELRNELVDKGHRFSTQSDTEVILHMYAEKGERCIEYFNGQWAFAIWDIKNQKLFLSRDRTGVRPLYYARTPESFVFASEMKSILVHPGSRREIDLETLDQVFTFWSGLAPRTMIKGIQELPPGHSMAVAEGKVRIWPYWQLDYSEIDSGMTEEDCAGRVLELLDDATRIRLRSDVPVGAYLSGGLDSSVISALAKKHSGRRLKTFSITFQDDEFDESAFQQNVIDMLQTEHHSVRCSYQDICDVFPKVVWHAETPLLRTAPAPLYLLSDLVNRDGYKVVLTGEGADEFFGGYDIFKEGKIRRFWAKAPGSRRRPLLLKRLYPHLQSLHAQSDAYLSAFFHVKPEDVANAFFSHLPRWELTAKLKSFFSDRVKSELGETGGYAGVERILPVSYSRWDAFSQAQYIEAATLLPGYLLSTQGDRVAMAHSVEGRFPFLDHRVVDFTTKIPPRLKMKVLNEKYVLKRAAGHLVPPSVRTRPKQPYRAPDAASFFDSTTRTARATYVDELLNPDRVRKDDLFNPAMVAMLVNKVRNGRAIGARDNMALVGILSTQLWVDQFINRSGDAHNGAG